MNYAILHDLLGKNIEATISGISMPSIEINELMKDMLPFLQKNRIMQSNYDIALNILERKKPKKYESSGVLIILS
jgi:hypothetical protein